MRGRPKLDPKDKRQYQRIAILKKTYNRATFNAAKRDETLLKYFDDLVPEEQNGNSK